MMLGFLRKRLIRLSHRRRADFVIGPKDAPYLRRWWLIPRNKWFNIYLHQFLLSDDDRALHDHMYINLSWLLRGRYLEHLQSGGLKLRKEGRFVIRRPTTAHRIQLIDVEPVWTLFVTGPRVREWGFWCPKGWRHWSEFSDPTDKGLVGKGCD